MKKTELKKVLKPLVAQCVREVLLEEGLLSNIVSEVATGLSPLLVENKNIYEVRNNKPSETQKHLELERAEVEEERRRLMKEHRRKILDATGLGKEIFEGVEPLNKGGSINETVPNGALAGVSPEDPGVDISGIMALGAHKWNKLI
jgi:phage antirepressor YoqD-like protein